MDDDYKIDMKDEIGSTTQHPEPLTNKQQPQSHNYQGYQGSQFSSTHDATPDEQKLNKQESDQEATGCMRFFSLQFYEKYFRVSQSEVIERGTLAFIPFKRDFIEKIRSNPDFYGPFWILTTLIFLLSSTGNLSRYFQNWQRDQYIFKLELVRYGVVILYSFGFGVPILLFFVMKFLGANNLTLPELICTYGYSFSCFIVIFLLCILPWGWLHWLLMVYGMANSITFLILNMAEYLDNMDKKGMYIVFGIIGLAQITLFLTFKLVFFDIIYDPET